MTEDMAAEIAQSETVQGTEVPSTRRDLSKPTTREEFIAAIEAMWPFMRAVAAERRWCRDWYRYACGVDEVFPGNATDRDILNLPAEDVTLDRDMFTEEGWTRYLNTFNVAYSARLTRIRRRILFWVRRGEITVEEANRVFAAGNLAEYTTPPTMPVYTLGLGYWKVRSDEARDSLAGKLTYDKVHAALAALADDAVFTRDPAELYLEGPDRDDDPLIPGADVDAPDYS